MSRPWMPLYVADYLADTQHLTTIEHGAYLLLIMHYWAKGALPNDDKRLASIARATPEQWGDMRDTLAEFFSEGWHHERIAEELEKSRKAYEKRANAGRAGGTAKAARQQSSSNATSNARAGLYQPQPQPHNSYPAPQHSYGTALDVVDARRHDLLNALGITDETKMPGLVAMSEPIRWVEGGCDVDADIIPALRAIAARGKSTKNWAYCSDAVFEARDRRLAPPPAPQSRPSPPRRKEGPVQALEQYLETQRNGQHRESQGNNADAERLPSNDGKLSAVAGLIHAAVNRPFE